MAHLPANHPGARIWHALVMMCITLPWLIPFTTGPNTAMVQWLVSGVCLALVGLICGLRGCRADTQDFARTLALAWLAAALLSSGIALIQYAGAGDRFTPWVASSEIGEAYSNLRQRNQFATLSSIGLLSLMYLRPRALWLWGGLVLLACANAASTSRTGAVQWILIAALAAWWGRGLASSAAGVAWRALLVYGLAVIALPRLLQAMTGSAHTGLLDRLASRPGCESRLTLWSNVLELIGQSPWTGWGWSSLKLAHFLHPYRDERFCALLDNAHNLPLHLAVELGVPAAALLLAAGIWWALRKAPWAETEPSRQIAWGVMGVIGLHSLLEYPLWYGPFQMAVLCALTLLWDNRPSRSAWLAGCSSLALAAVLWVTWDYVRVTQLYLQPDDRIEAFRDNTLGKVGASRFFRDEVRFAEVTTSVLTPENAADIYPKASALLAFSPEPRIIQVTLNSAMLLGLNDEKTRRLQERFAVVYPEEYTQWRAACTACPP